MGFKEGWSEGERIAQRIYDISSEFEGPEDPKMMERFIQCGLPWKTIEKLKLRFSKNPEEYGTMAAGVAFFLTHGTIWNWGGMRRK